MQITHLPTALLFARSDARVRDTASVKALVESVREVGILQPLRVRPTRKFLGGREADAYEIVAGAHRHEAARQLALDTVPCVVCDDDDLHAELAMIDENLCRAELSAAQRAEQTARRKAIYEELHPETRHGGDRASRQVGDLNPDRFTAETATRTGRSERAVQRDAERGEKVDAEALRLVAGTDLDKGAYLDKLKGIEDPAAQVEKVRRDLAAPRAGKPPKVAADPLTGPLALEKQVARLMDAWNAAAPEAREEFLGRIDAPVMDGTRFG